MTRVVCLVMVLLLPASAFAEPYKGYFLSVGLKRCKTFTDQRAKVTDSFTRMALETAYLAWVDGFLSGMNATKLVANKNNQGVRIQPIVYLSPRSMPKKSRLNFLVNYCLDNPGKTVMQAASALYGRFARIKKAQR